MMCVDCGTDVPRLIGGSCPTCFVSQTKLLEAPEVYDILLCAHCDARQVGAHWQDPGEGDDLAWIREEALRSELKVHARVENPQVSVEEVPQDERNFVHKVGLTGTVDEAPVEFAKDILVRMKRSVCDRCSRMVGGYYAAIIQFRATDRDVTPGELERAHRIVSDELDRIRATGNREAFLSKSGPVPGGFDYYLGDIEGTRSVSRTLADRLGANVEEHAKLAGRKEGNDIYRVTFRVRIRLFAPGDFAILHDKPVQYLQSNRGRAMVRDLGDHSSNKVDEVDLRRIGGWETLKDAVLVSEDAANIQLLDPVDFRTVDVPRPEGWVSKGETVPVLRYEERLYIPALDPPRRPAEKERAKKH